MSKKLKLTPKASYILGIYAYNDGIAVGLTSKSNEVVEKFTKTVMEEFGVEPEKFRIEEQADGSQHIYFHHSKLKKLLDRALERKEITFKYKNEYAASYLAGIFDAKGGKDSRCLYIMDLKPSDELLFTRLDFHTRRSGRKTYVMNEGPFVAFIREFSVRRPRHIDKREHND